MDSKILYTIMETQSDTIERLREQIASLEVENEKLYNETEFGDRTLNIRKK